jgi:single-strand DNA-binding protein
MYKVCLIGNLTKDPEFRTVGQANTSVADVTICCNTGKEGNKLFEKITFWGKDAELAAKYLAKGREIYIEAEAYDDSWTDQSGVKKERRSFRCRTFKFLGKGEDFRND